MKKHTFQENYERIFGSIKEGWWDDMSDEAQQKYIDKHGSAPGVVQRATVGGGDPSVTPHDPGEPEADVAGEDDYDMGEVPGSREEWEDIEPGDPEMRSGDESAEELGDLMKQQQNHIEDMFEKGADREDIEAAEGNLEDLEREYDEKVAAEEPDYSPGHPDNMDDDELKQFLDKDAEEDEGEPYKRKPFQPGDDPEELSVGAAQDELEKAKAEMAHAEKMGDKNAYADAEEKEYALQVRLGITGRTGKELDQETLTIDGKQFRRISEGKINTKFIKYRVFDKIADEINKVEPDDFNLRKFKSLERPLTQFIDREIKRDKKITSGDLRQAIDKSDFDDKVFGRSGIIDDWYKKSEKDFPEFMKKYTTYSDNPKRGWKKYNASSLTYGISKPLYKVLDSFLSEVDNLVSESKYQFAEFYERFKR